MHERSSTTPRRVGKHNEHGNLFQRARLPARPLARAGRGLHLRVRCRGVRLRAPEPRQDPPAGQRRATLSAPAPDSRATPRGTVLVAVGRSGARPRPDRRRVHVAARHAVRSAGRSAPELRDRSRIQPLGEEPPAPRRGRSRGRRPRRRVRHGSGRHLCGRSGVPWLRQLARTAQLARSDQLQSAMEPLPSRRQGREDGLQRLRLVRRRLRGKNERRARAPGAPRDAGALARAGELPRVPHAFGDGGDRRHALLGRLLGTRARHAAELPVPGPGRRRGLRPLDRFHREHRRWRRAGVSG